MAERIAVPGPATALDKSPFPSREAREIERAQKREAVLLAAVRMFNARGFHATSLDDVAASLNISKPTVYYYLGNKEDILLECLARGMALLRAAAEDAAKSAGSGLGRLQSFSRRYAEIAMDDFGRSVIRTDEEVLSSDGARRFRAQKGEIDRHFRAFIAEGMKDGSIAPVDVKMAAFTLAGALSWTARWHDPNGPMTPPAIAATMVDLLTTGIAAQS
jgi:AcrR family transcriptional regulator